MLCVPVLTSQFCVSSYAALGLLSSVKINTAGGLDPRDPFHQSAQASSGSEGEEEESDEDEEVEAPAKGKDKGKAVARKGMARIIRDEDGNVVDIIEAEKDEEEEEPQEAEPAPTASSKRVTKRKAGKEATPWGAPLNDSSDDEGASAPRRKKLTAEEKAARDRALMLPTLPATSQPAAGAEPNKIHAELEQLQDELSKPVPRFSSHQEEGWLKYLVRKYGENFDEASRDRRLNIWQKTSGEIKRA